MELFSGVASDFATEAAAHRLAPILAERFKKQTGCKANDSEVKSWDNSLTALASCVDVAQLQKTGVVVEYRLPLSSCRLDAMFVGRDDAGERGVIVELKQWNAAYSCGVEDCVVMSENYLREICPHPSKQAASYADYLRGCHTAFYSDDEESCVQLEPCSFMHNAKSNSCGDVLSTEFSKLLKRSPLYTSDKVDEFCGFLRKNVGRADGEAVLNKIKTAKTRPSKKLLEQLSSIIAGKPIYTLLDDQIAAYNAVLSSLRSAETSEEKVVVVVKGGPGTGKSVIAIRLLAEFARQKKNVLYCTGSKAFTTNLRAIVGSEAAYFFKYFNNFVDSAENDFDVIIADEAHRLRASSNDRFRRRSTKPQVLEIIDAAKVSVFLLDEHQSVRPDEVGTPKLVLDAAEERKAKVFQIPLKAQFRCAGSDSYLAWLDYLLGLGGAPDTSWRSDYEFRICNTVEDMEQLIRARSAQGSSARLVAGFCWPWSNPKSDGSLVADVDIANWHRPWNRKPTGRETAKNHPYTIWATKPEGENQIGCIFSAQGFEFDYCGVIFGEDLSWLKDTKKWVGLKGSSFDPAIRRTKGDCTKMISNAYRVLLSRGMRGTFVFFTNPETRAHVEEMLAGTT
jgi:DUF2075 family protein